MKTENTERKERLSDIAEKQKIVSELITWAVDNYSDSPAFGLLASNLKNVSDQIQKINLEISCPAELVKSQEN